MGLRTAVRGKSPVHTYLSSEISRDAALGHGDALAAVRESTAMVHEQKRCSVIRVGEGRGFVMEADRQRLVITAGHCLPEIPSPESHAYPKDRTFLKLIGPLGDQPSVAVECRFVDPISDLAVLGPPDAIAFGSDANAYDA